MTLIVLGLDALDAALVEQFDVPSLTLETHGQMETVAEMRDQPYTPEVWATIATGRRPGDHGVFGGTSVRDNTLVNFLANVTGQPSLSFYLQIGKVNRQAGDVLMDTGRLNTDEERLRDLDYI